LTKTYERLYIGGYVDPAEEELQQLESYLSRLTPDASLEELQNVETIIENTVYSQAIMAASQEELDERIYLVY